MTAATAMAAPQQFEDMARPVVMSSIFHLVLLVLALVGLPHIVPELPVVENSIAIEIVELDQKPQTPKPAPKNDRIKAPAPPKPAPPKVDAKTPSRPVAPKPPELSEDMVLPRNAETLKPVTLPDRKPVRDNADEQEKEFLKILKNLQDSKPVPQAEETGALKTGKRSSLISRLADQMTIGEQEELRRQLGMCWNVAAGARYAEDIVVKLEIVVNPDRTVRDARVVDQFRYNRDSFFQAAADAAIRAVYHPGCTPLILPPDKYKQWNVITINFDPREML